MTENIAQFCGTPKIIIMKPKPRLVLPSHYKEWSGNSAKVFVLSFCSPLCNFVHGQDLLNPLYFSIMKELSNSSAWV